MMFCCICSVEQCVIIDKFFCFCQKVYQECSYCVEFVCFVFKYGLVSEVIYYELWDEGWEGLGEWVWDVCFEMGDFELVIVDVVECVCCENFFDVVCDYCMVFGVFECWLSYVDCQVCLF